MAFFTPPSSCLLANRIDHIATEATRQVFARFTSSVCTVYPDTPNTFDDPLTAEFMDKCNGTLYRQCELPDNRTVIVTALA